ncbi:flagellar biosynthesis protein FlgA [Candidimonas sp. SYP-B2681]|uniref:NAD(P)H-dependent oxidoreductase n=1 Tax=Candidimonas sp. SYP-B2681 TaxID=2497686 RepID=UPI000F87E018|nr:flagellar biosynthesis protein FlgA [Candidimonas sp. SYP-B2681]RTZ41637.1 flagellar biosynthesis protein FlgA [Candidimonas sp. SYP-B2681]
MNFHKYFSNVSRPVESCVVGSGGFGRSFLAQSLRTPLLSCKVAVDIDALVVVEAMHSVGIARDSIRVCEDAEAALSAWNAGFYIATSDLAHVAGLPLDIVLEATGNPEAGARHSKIALENDLHLVLVSKEVDSVVGPGLAHKAKGKGLVVTPVDGDQPSLLIGLITWAQVLGLEIVAAGKASEYDFVFDPATGRMSSNGVVIDVPEFESLWELDKKNALEVVAARSELCHRLPQRAVPDFCEMLVVANATGLAPDTPEFHVPILRIPEVPGILRLSAEGGVLADSGKLELFHCLRKPNELSFAGGVFIVVRCHDAPTWDLLAGKGHVVSADQKTALLYIPRHLLGLEAASSVIEAAALGVSSGGSEPRPNQDLVGRATQALSAGAILTMGGHHHSIDHVAPVLMPALPLADESPAPFYLIANRRLRRDVAEGQFICLADVEIEASSVLLELRKYQDNVFFSDSQ